MLTAFTCTTLSLSLALGSSVAYAAPAEDGAPAEGEAAPAEDAPDVSAEDRDEGERLSEQAIAKFQAKDFEGAVALFEQAYKLDPQPNYLFNIGRVHEEAGNLEAAVEYYAKFVKQPGVDLDSRGTALERLKVLREILQETGEPEPTDETPVEEPPPEDEKPVEPPPEPVDDGSEKKRKSIRGAGFAMLGIGAAALIGGGVVGGLAQADNNAAGEAATPDEGRNLLEASQTKALTADVLFGVGGALVLTGVILVAVGLKKPKTGERVAFTPTFGPQGAGATLRLRF